PSVTMK
ncbi:hypothetical protein D046_5733B, partial [Vibrio parahaemolyticus V-223/04]